MGQLRTTNKRHKRAIVKLNVPKAATVTPALTGKVAKAKA